MPPAGYDGDQSRAAQLWPATPTPSADLPAGYGFGVMDHRPEYQMTGPMALPLQPPPEVAAMAAAAMGASGSTQQEFRRERARTQEAHKVIKNAKLTTVKNTFVHVENEDNEDDEGLGMPPKSKTVPNMYTKQLSLEQTLQMSEEPEETDEEVYARVQELALAGELPSKGSVTHGSGKCRPCAWFWKAQGCQNAKECGYCHMCPEGELKSRKKSKVQAMKMGALVPARGKGGGKRHHDEGKGGAARVLKLSPLI